MASLANRPNRTLVPSSFFFPRVGCQFCCGLQPGVIELLPEEEAISQCEDLASEETAPPMRFGVEVSESEWGRKGAWGDCVSLVVAVAPCKREGPHPPPHMTWS